MGTDNFITLFFLVVAGLIFFNLRSVLGRRTGHENPPPREEWSRPQDAQPQDDGKVVTLPRRDAPTENNPYAAVDAFVGSDKPLNAELRKLVDADPSFNPKEFVEGARMAYEMIVTAFAEGDRKTLKSLLSAEVYDGFNAAITAREKAGETMKTTFVGIDRADITKAMVDATDVTVTMRIVSKLINATYDRSGAVIDGNAETVAEVIDLWSFSRDIRSRDPNWKLVSTESEG